MKSTSTLILSEIDFKKISALIERAPKDIADLLADELNRAQIVPENQLPKGVVTMNSKVTFIDIETGVTSTITLVYPQDANIEEHKISILAPIGSALIGLQVGQSIQWPIPNQKEKTLRVDAVEESKS